MNDLISSKYNQTIKTGPQDYATHALSAATWKAYQNDLNHFLAWGGVIPATEGMVADYLTEHAPGFSIATLKRRLVSISASLRGKADFTKSKNLIFVTLMAVAGLMLATTGYKGAELVYRHGLGVIPMQVGMTAGHNHSHGGGEEGHGEGHDMKEMDMEGMEHNEGSESGHEHTGDHQH